MASPYKIPKKKQPEDGVSDSLEMQSPLSRLVDGPGSLKKSWELSSRSRADRMHAGIGLGSRAERDGMPRQPLFSGVVVKTLLGFDRPIKVGPIMSAANRRPGGILGPYPANHRADYLAKRTWNNQSCSGTPTRRPGQKPPESTSCVPNGWRPKRASDRLFQETVPAKWESVSSPEEKRHSSSSSSPEFSDSVLCVKSSSVELVDSHLPAQEDAGSSRSTSLGQKTQRPGRNTTKRDSSERESSPEAVPNLLKKNPSSGTTRIICDWTSDEDFHLPCRTSPDKKVPSDSQKHSSSSVLMTSNRFTLNRTTPWVSASKNLSDEQKEQERDRWRGGGSSLSLHLKPRRTKQTPAEPIVLSSEEEEGEDDEGDGEQSSRMEASHLQPPGDVPSGPGERAGSRVSVGPTPSFMELEFSSLHAGLVHANASSSMMISERGINFPLTDSQALGGEVEFVTVVASEVRGYGVWDGGMVQDGTLLVDWEGPAPSLLFLWVTDAQANLIMSQLPTTHPGPSCSFLLLVLKEQLVGLQAALLASMLDMEEFRRGRSSSLRSPLDWTDGLLLLHSAPPPLDQHFLSLLGHTVDRQEEKPSHAKTRGRKSLVQPAMLQSLSLPSRLIQYPAAPCKGRIAVTKEDLACLDSGEFLNDVIIDFYLKYLLLEGVGGAVAERCHIFSSFFFKQLSRRRTAGEDDAPFIPDRHTRHQRVKTWTRHVDIFTKDFLFVPVNQEAHWYLVVICFPGLEESHYEVWKGPATGEDSGVTSGLQSQADQRPRSSGGLSSVSQPSAGGTDQASNLLPGCTQQGWQGEMVLKRPCILVMDSLKLSHHENVCQLLRGYLHVEWGVRRGTPRLFTPDTMKSSNCRVPLQDNSSDCGLYLLQYVESFMTNPAVHYQLPLRLEHWFPRQQVWRKREEIRSLVMKMHLSQQKEEDKRP